MLRLSHPRGPTMWCSPFIAWPKCLCQTVAFVAPQSLMNNAVQRKPRNPPTQVGLGLPAERPAGALGRKLLVVQQQWPPWRRARVRQLRIFINGLQGGVQPAAGTLAAESPSDTAPGMPPASAAATVATAATCFHRHMQYTQVWR